jgi:hypothetical protein
MDPKQRRGGCSTSRTSAGCGCRGKDLGPLETSEDPSESDIEQFSGVTRVCSGCKAEVYDDAELCHNCGRALTSAEAGRYLPTWAIATTFVLLAGGMLLLIFKFI